MENFFSSKKRSGFLSKMSGEKTIFEKSIFKLSFFFYNEMISFFMNQTKQAKKYVKNCQFFDHFFNHSEKKSFLSFLNAKKIIFLVNRGANQNPFFLRNHFFLFELRK